MTLLGFFKILKRNLNCMDFFESNLVTITNVDKKNIINALDNIVDTGTYQDMVKDN